MSQSPIRSNENPFASPEYQGPASGGVLDYPHWQGRTLVVPKNATLPMRCLKCGVEIEGKARKRTDFIRYDLWPIALVLVNWILATILTLVMQKSAKATAGYCRNHGRSRLVWGFLGVAIMMFGPVPFFLRLQSQSLSAFSIAAAHAGASIVQAIGMWITFFAGAPIHVEQINEKEIRLSNAAPNLLDPPFGVSTDGHWNSQGEWVVGAQWGEGTAPEPITSQAPSPRIDSSRVAPRAHRPATE